MYQTSWLNTTVGPLTRPGFAQLLQNLSLGDKVTFSLFELTQTASQMSVYNIYLYMRGIKSRLRHERLASQSHTPVNQSQDCDGGLLMNSKRRCCCSSSPLLPHPGCCHMLQHEPHLPTSKAMFWTPSSDAANEGASPATAFEVWAEGEVWRAAERKCAFDLLHSSRCLAMTYSEH